MSWLSEGNQSNGRPNSEGTIQTKLRYLSRIYEFWQDEPSLPKEFNPFELAIKKANLRQKIPPDPPNLSIEEVRDAVKRVPHVRDRAMAVVQFELGLRAGEVVNIRIEDIDLEGPDIRDHYDGLGTHPVLDGTENAIYIPPRDDKELPWPGRDGNRSRRPRVTPLDDELRRVIRNKAHAGRCDERGRGER